MAGEQVLIIDDNVRNLKLARLALENLGYDLSTASDAETALVIMQGRAIDLVLLDLELPGMDGLSLTRQMRASADTCDIGVIIVTAAAGDGSERSAFLAGCDAFVRKPIDTRALPLIAARVLGARSARKVTVVAEMQ